MAGRRKPAAIGHNSADFEHVLKATYSQVQALNAQIGQLNAQKSEAYKEARAAGIDLRVFGAVLSRQQQDRSDVQQRDHDIAAYEAILFGREGDHE